VRILAIPRRENKHLAHLPVGQAALNRGWPGAARRRRIYPALLPACTANAKARPGIAGVGALPQRGDAGGPLPLQFVRWHGWMIERRGAASMDHWALRALRPAGLEARCSGSIAGAIHPSTIS